MVSLRSIAAKMDPGIHGPGSTEKISLRRIAAGHRWIEVEPLPAPAAAESALPNPAIISLRSIFNRHAESSSSTHRFLSYNTYLIPGIHIDWDSLLLAGVDGGLPTLLQMHRISVADALGSFSVTASDMIAALSIDPLALASHFKITGKLADALGSSFFGKALDEILSVVGSASFLEEAAKIIGTVNASRFVGLVSPTSILDAVAKIFGPTAVLARLGISLPADPGRAPALEARAGELALVLPGEYDIMALSEVFLPESASTLASAWSTQGLTVDTLAGPEAVGIGVFLSSGLLTITSGRPVDATKNAAVIFQTRGSRFLDADAWSNKGFTRRVISLGAGSIELYGTHTISGGDFEFFLNKRTHEEYVDLRLQQLGEILDYVDKHRDPANVCIVTGDMNINGRDATDYLKLVNLMKSHNFYDAWNQWNLSSVQRATNDSAVPNHDTVCECGSLGSPQVHCTITGMPAGEGPCLDYIFVERPTLQHSFHLDVTRVRRRPCRRAPTEGIAYLSDHIGLDVVLVASVKSGI